MDGPFAVEQVGVAGAGGHGWELRLVADQHELGVGECDGLCESRECVRADRAGLVDQNDPGSRSDAGAHRLLAVEQRAIDGARWDPGFGHDAGCGAGGRDAVDGDARACVGLGDCSERGCLAGSGDGANERDRSRVGDHAADEVALLVAEREAALCLYARDAIVRLGLGEDELAQGGSLGELR